MGGTLTGVAKISGTGTSGPSLQKTLAGNFDIGSTNLNLAIPSLRSPLLKTIVNVVAVVPELIKNPNAGLGSLTGALFGSGASSQKGSWTDELMQSPIDVIQARGTMGAGRIELASMLIQSPAFQAGAKGNITLTPVLTNSLLDIPLTVAVKRSLAETINFVPAGTPTNVTYVKLPDYVAVTGTVGNPGHKLNKAALLGTALQQLGGNIPGVDKKTGDLLQNLGGVLTGNRGITATNAPAGANQSGNLLQGLGGILGGANQRGTNAPAQAGTNQPADRLLQGLGGLLGGNRAGTNAPGPASSTNRPLGTNQPTTGNLLDQLLGPKKK